MFVWTIGDAIGLAIVAISTPIIVGAVLTTLVRRIRCSHDSGVNETQACDAICKECGKNLGFIGAWRENHPSV